MIEATGTFDLQKYSDYTANNGQSNEVRTYVMSGRTMPKPNMVVMHACSTLQTNTSYFAPNAFDLISSDGMTVQPNYAYGGFGTVLWSLTQKGFPLDMHAKHIYERLSSGRTIRDAVDDANYRYLPKTTGGGSLGMILKGDPASRLNTVYTTDHSRTADRWFVTYE